MDFPTRVAGLHNTVTDFTATTSASGRAARGSIDQIEDRLERQNMVIQTLLMLLLEKKVIEEKEFREWMNYVDRLDGRADGKLRENIAPRSCPGCGRMNPAKAPQCQYCGHDLPRDVIDPRHKPR
jgi:hypothetical protein